MTMNELTIDLTREQLRKLLDPDRSEMRVPVADDGRDTTPLAEVQLGDEVDLHGIVRSVDSKNTFEQDNGDEGQVRGIRIQDATGDLRVALWGEDADTNVEPGDYVYLTGIEIQEGWKDDIDGSCGWSSTISVEDEPEDEIEYVNLRLLADEDNDD